MMNYLPRVEKPRTVYAGTDARMHGLLKFLAHLVVAIHPPLLSVDFGARLISISGKKIIIISEQ